MLYLFTVNICKDKWRSIRDGYKKYKSRIKRDNQVMKWKYANKVRFLEEFEPLEAKTMAGAGAQMKWTKSDILNIDGQTSERSSNFTEQAVVSRKLINEVKKYPIVYRNTGNVLEKKYAWLNISIAMHMNGMCGYRLD